MFFGESRLSDRRKVNRHAKLQVADGSLTRDCMVTNISDSGVRLHVEGFDVPDRFVLLISEGEGGARPRNCKVVWRLGFELGVEFLDLPGRRGEQPDVASAEQPAAV
jgi:PilZ domain-containing protein